MSEWHTFQTALDKKSRLLGMWSVLRDPDLVEIAGKTGFDFTIVDFEHGPHSMSDLSNMVRAGKGTGMLVGVRPSGNHEKEILRLLESDPDGVFIPHIRSVEEAKLAVNACLYPPLGVRGSSGYTRSSTYGLTEFREHKKRQNDQIFICILIESKEGIDNLCSIVEACPELHAIYFGTYDIASSMDIEDPASDEVTIQVESAIEKSLEINPDLTFGQVAHSVEEAKGFSQHISVVPLLVDCGLIAKSFSGYTSAFNK